MKQKKPHSHRKAKVIIGFNFGKTDKRKNVGDEVTCDEITKEVFEVLLRKNAIEEIKK